MHITISFKFLLLLFILFENVILQKINKKNNGAESSVLFDDNNKSINLIHNLEAVNITLNSDTTKTIQLNNLINLKEILISENKTEIPTPLLAQKFNENDENEENTMIATNIKKFTPRQLGRKRNKQKFSKKPSLIDVALQNAAQQGLEAMNMLYEHIEPEILKKKRFLSENHPAAKLAKFSAPTEGLINSDKAAFAALVATKTFQKSYKRTTAELGRQATSTRFSFRRTALEGLCPQRETPVCLPAAKRYRTHDGTCNNFKHPRWGSAQMPFNRFLPPEYGDGIDSIRGSVEGGTLSSARFVSLLVHGAREGNAPVTLLLAQWGQLLDHDLTSTAQPRSINGTIPRCCGPNDFHPSCFPIKVPLDDPWLASLKVRCLEFLRSAPAQRRDCVMSWREQTNQATSFLDASPIYSSNARTSDNARVFRNGKLQFGRGNPTEDVCQRGAFSPHCIKPGDPRSGEQPGLLALHHVWVSEHNRIATDLSTINPHWSDEKVYQETRRIIGSIFQHITYREFLPLVLGREVCRLFDLDLLHSGYYTGYDSHINPTIANAFSAAAFRFGHSLVPNSYIRCDQTHHVIQNNVSLHEEFAQGDIGTRGSLHRLLRGMATQRALQRDEFITPELTNHLFQSGSFPFGLDLAAINIQRGRDHGIPPYTSWREPCGLSLINDWEDLINIIGPESVRRIRHAYISVHDIDLFVGGIAERAVVGGLVGPTFACIIAQQFSNLRRGDRFWYENGGFENSFTPAQLHSVRRVSFAQILCRTTGSGTFQPHIFMPHDAENNERILCGHGVLAPIDLRPWQELDPFKNTGTDNPTTNDIPFPINNKEIETDILTLNDDTTPTMSSKDTEMDSKATSILVNRIDFVPNGSTGFHRPQSGHFHDKINDKLDFVQHQKHTTKRPRPPSINLQIIDNKLDSSKKNKKQSTQPTKRTTTKRKAFVNNVAIELGRTANKNKKDKQPTNETLQEDKKQQKEDQLINETTPITTKENETTIQSTETNNETNRNETDIEQTKDNIKLDSMTNTFENISNKRTLTNRRTGTVHIRTKQHHIPTDKGRNLVYGTVQHQIIEQTIQNIKQEADNDSDTINTKTNVTLVFKIPTIESKTTELTTATEQTNTTIDTNCKPFELRTAYYDNDVNYNRHPSVISVDAPNSNSQYEIEINIRKTNKNKQTQNNIHRQQEQQPQQNTEYDLDLPVIPIRNDFSNIQPSKNPFSYRPITQNSYYQQHTNSQKTTKPPKIFYVDEDETLYRPTSPQPNFFQSLFPSFTGNFNGFINNVNKHPLNNDFTNIPNRRGDTIISGHTTQSNNLISGIVSNNINGIGINSNNYRPIHSNSNDGTTISITIRPPQPTSLQNAGVIPTINPRPQFGPVPLDQKPLSSFNNGNSFYNPSGFTHQTYIDRLTTTTRRTFYDQLQYRPITLTSYRNTNYRPTTDYRQGSYRPVLLNNFAEHKKLDIELDHARSKLKDNTTTTMISATIITTTTANIVDTKLKPTDTSNETDIEDYDYYDDNDNDDDNTDDNSKQQYDKDGYLRPEYMFISLLKTEIKNMTNISSLNDNFVMPVLTENSHMTFNTETNTASDFIDTIGRNPITDITADEDNDDILTTEKPKNLNKMKPIFAADSPFVPINVLTKPERPDNWIIYDTLVETAPLPDLPKLNADANSSNEFPKPMKDMKWKNIFNNKRVGNSNTSSSSS